MAIVNISLLFLDAFCDWRMVMTDETELDKSKNSYISDVVWDKSKNTYTDEELRELLKQTGIIDLSYATLIAADLQKADLRQTILRGADLRGAYLQGASLQEVNLLGADLLGADLQGAHLQGAHLQGANLRGANLLEADLLKTNLLGANITRAKFEYAKNWKDAIGIPQEIFLIAQTTKIKEKQNQIEKLVKELEEAQKNTNSNNIEKIQQLENDLSQAKKEKINLEIQLKTKLETHLGTNIKEAQKAIATSLKNADKHIKEYSITATIIGISAIILIAVDLGAILYLGFHYEAFFNSLEKFKEFGAWALTLYSFPILIVFSIAITLFRHQKKLLDEVRHYSGEKRQIELYSGLLKASQYVATSLNDPQESATYVKETFDKIRDRILSEQPHTNTAGSAVEKEEYSSSLEPLIKVISDMIAKSEVKK